MTEPTSGVIGVKYLPTIAGFVGALISLSFLKELKAWQMVSAVFTGTATAHYGLPLVLWLWPSLSTGPSGAFGFLLGLTAMNLVPGVVKLSELVRDNPTRFLPWKK